MKNFNKFDGISSHEIKEYTSQIKELLRDHSQFNEKVDSLKTFIYKTELMNRYLKENKIIFEIINMDKELMSNLERSINSCQFIKKNLEEIIGIANNEIGIPFEKMHNAIYASLNLIEEKFKLENDFKNS